MLLAVGLSLSPWRDFISQGLEVLERRVERFVTLGKVETDQVVDGLAEEA